MNAQDEIMVSVCMISYNHEKFIAEALNGVFMQQTDFKVELILAEDCSPDNTQRVVNEILNSYKGKIIVRYTRHEQNKGMMSNFIWALNQCKVKYIALCDGDDYWTDPLKLQKQVDFLEENEDCVICFHDVNVLEKNDEIVEDYIAKPKHNSIGKDKLFLQDLLENGNCMHTPSVVFRRPNDFTDYSIFKESPIGDYPLYLFLLSKGGVAQSVKEKMAIYRKDVGVFSIQGNLQKDIHQMKMLTLLLSVEWLNNEEKSILSERIKSKISALEGWIHEKEYLLLSNSDLLSKKVSFMNLIKALLYKSKNLIFKSE